MASRKDEKERRRQERLAQERSSHAAGAAAPALRHRCRRRARCSPPWWRSWSWSPRRGRRRWTAEAAGARRRRRSIRRPAASDRPRRRRRRRPTASFSNPPIEGRTHTSEKVEVQDQPAQLRQPRPGAGRGRRLRRRHRGTKTWSTRSSTGASSTQFDPMRIRPAADSPAQGSLRRGPVPRGPDSQRDEDALRGGGRRLGPHRGLQESHRRDVRRDARLHASVTRTRARVRPVDEQRNRARQRVLEVLMVRREAHRPLGRTAAVAWRAAVQAIWLAAPACCARSPYAPRAGRLRARRRAAQAVDAGGRRWSAATARSRVTTAALARADGAEALQPRRPALARGARRGAT